MYTYENDIKQAALSDSYFDKSNAKEISSYHNESIKIVLDDIRAKRNYYKSKKE